MIRPAQRLLKLTDGFTLVEVLVAAFIFPILVVGISHAFEAVSKSYSVARQLNEMYAVLAACPEMDRALEYSSLSSTTNCYPTNVFQSEGGTGTTITYNPNLTVTDTAALPSGDPLKDIPDSKVVYITVGYFRGSGQPLQLRMLITRNGIGQL